MSSAVVSRSLVRMALGWDDAPRPTPAQLTTLRHLFSDLTPLLARVDVIPDQTDDPVLNAAAEQVHDALRALLAEIAIMIYRRR